ncbi:MAG: hypothetical protein ACREQJ_02795, partial [Candidatus Binatia bacterium]
MIVRGAEVEVELEPGRWRVRWPELGIGAGPFAASVAFAGESRSTPNGDGAWTISRSEGPDGVGNVAVWRAADSAVALRLHVPDRGSFVAVDFAATPPRALGLVALSPLVGALGLPPSSRRLVNGYQSWDYAGVRPAAAPG